MTTYLSEAPARAAVATAADVLLMVDALLVLTDDRRGDWAGERRMACEIRSEVRAAEYDDEQAELDYRWCLEHLERVSEEVADEGHPGELWEYDWRQADFV